MKADSRQDGLPVLQQLHDASRHDPALDSLSKELAISISALSMEWWLALAYCVRLGKDTFTLFEDM
jgi:hypothetical protein